MKKISFVIAWLILSLLVSAWTPAAEFSPPVEAVKATKVPQILIVNKTGSQVIVTFTGPKTYVVYAVEQKTIQIVEFGKYNYTYQACGIVSRGSLTVKLKTVKLTIPNCKTNKGQAKGKTEAGTVAVTINNKTGSTMTLTLTGPAYYRLIIGVGKSVYTIVKGTYAYSAYGCGTYKTGTVKIKYKGQWVWWCEG